MAQSSDEIIKRDIIDVVGTQHDNAKLRIFPESSNEDQILFSNGGLTFGFNGVKYGSCDACWFQEEEWIDPYDNKKIYQRPIIALEGTDALSRKSSGNAQYQRFHHALGALKAGVIAIYYLRKGNEKIQPDLYAMAYNASRKEEGYYLVIDDLTIVKEILDSYEDKKKLKEVLEKELGKMKVIADKSFLEKYKGSWEIFSQKRSTIISANSVIKHAGRSIRNFTDSSQRAGHIAVGEMYLTKYYFYEKDFYYLFTKMTREDMAYLDENKLSDKEWFLLRNEPNVYVKTLDDLIGVPVDVKKNLLKIRLEPLKGDVIKLYNSCMKVIEEGLRKGSITLDKNYH